MKSVVCTLYEGHYHYGVAGLVNSLYTHGFRGDFYIGYKGELPFWAFNANNNPLINWEESKTLQAAPDLYLHFLPVKTDVHFTNYKPDFIIQLWEKCINGSDSSGLFYFDPDIVNKCKWEFYERWITYGVALVHEIVWNDMPYNHPKRHQWMSVAEALGLSVKNKLNSNINAGFFGISKDRMGFVKMWKQLIDQSSILFSLDKTKFLQNNNDYSLFKVGDQDLLNLTAMCTDEDLSEFGPEGMDFTGGGWLMSHATGSPKPWKTNYLGNWLKGKKPSAQSREYWKNANGVIKCYSDSYIRRKIFCQTLAALLSRFYSK